MRSSLPRSAPGSQKSQKRREKAAHPLEIHREFIGIVIMWACVRIGQQRAPPSYGKGRVRMQPRSSITSEAHRGRQPVDYFLNLVQLAPLMERSSGAPEIVIGLMDGPVALNHPDLVAESVRGIAGELGAGCAHSGSTACIHGTFTAGTLSAKRGSPAQRSARDARCWC